MAPEIPIFEGFNIDIIGMGTMIPPPPTPLPTLFAHMPHWYAQIETGILMYLKVIGDTTNY